MKVDKFESLFHLVPMDIMERNILEINKIIQDNLVGNLTPAEFIILQQKASYFVLLKEKGGEIYAKIKRKMSRDHGLDLDLLVG